MRLFARIPVDHNDSISLHYSSEFLKTYVSYPYTHHSDASMWQMWLITDRKGIEANLKAKMETIHV